MSSKSSLMGTGKEGPADVFTMFGTTFRGAEITQSPASEDAKQQIARSFIAAGVGPALVLMVCMMERLKIAAHLPQIGFSVYVGWASYLGIMAFIGFLADFGDREFGWVSGKWILLWISRRLSIVGIIFIAVAPGIVYGVMGGGLREFIAYRRIVKNPNAVSG